MMKIRPAQTALSLIVFLGIIGMLSFQNCSKVQVSDLKEIESSVGVAEGQPVTEIISEPIAMPAPTPQPMPPAPALTPQILISSNAMTVVEGQKATVTVTFQDVENVSYICSDKISKEMVSTGMISASGQTAQVLVDRDLLCQAFGYPIGQSVAIQSSVNINLDCANRMKNAGTNRCEDFTCKKVIEISANDLLNIPERTSEGLCYAAKIMNGIASSQSRLTTELDRDVLSRDHDLGGEKSRNPYLMGLAQNEFRINGPRVVKLAGGLNPNQKILVDNFILMGVYPAQQDVSNSISSVFHVMGTSDSAVFDSSGRDTGAISFKNVLLPVVKYGSAGTSSVSAVDVTRSIQPQVIHRLDIRALDCGGQRELSDIYILFQ